ncbi:E3 ubiquitin protein ligase DRIP2 [Rhynchospora pubera]|uniref:E3 ubiquitin protein ligase DRIP2 n=1 Tax=Rhynchospora pubera TaxID=906938 RepID=A0AAV8FWG8_9POAL|nr:E3 ubiquitin protein ligase DRIP2 [Rhynchospora pubera]
MPLGRRRRALRAPPSASQAPSPPPPLSPLVARGEVRVKRHVLASCLTCPLCHRLLRHATTIRECLHTFCRKCITKKIADEDEECCPVCKTDLGCSAFEKLRPDHHLQYIRERLFPIKRKSAESDKDPPQQVPPIDIQIQKVKERSLSSLVATDSQLKASRRIYSSDDSSTPRSSNVRKKSKLAKLKEEENTGPRDEPVMMTYARRQTNSDVDGPNSHSQKKEIEDKKGLNMIKPENSGSAMKRKRGKIAASNGHIVKLSRISEEGKHKGNKFLKVRRNSSSSRTANVSAKGLLNSKPIWFSLIASSTPEGGAVLPQLTANFVRIKDGEMNVSSIQKYVKNRLGLGSENEVEIVCRGQTINPDMTMHGLMNMWIRNESSDKIKTIVGTPAKEFVMELLYHLKFQSSATASSML